MSEYEALIVWDRGGERFVDNRYKRAHRWEFDGGATVPGSSSPHSVPPPLSDVSAVDPEEAFVASLASCHMLWFLSIAAKRGFCLDSYRDRAVGTMAKDDRGKLVITTVILRPHAVFTAERQPSDEVVKEMHELAHAECFLANSVKSEVRTIPTFEIRQ